MNLVLIKPYLLWESNFVNCGKANFSWEFGCDIYPKTNSSWIFNFENFRIFCSIYLFISLSYIYLFLFLFLKCKKRNFIKFSHVMASFTKSKI